MRPPSARIPAYELSFPAAGALGPAWPGSALERDPAAAATAAEGWEEALLSADSCISCTHRVR